MQKLRQEVTAEGRRARPPVSNLWAVGLLIVLQTQSAQAAYKCQDAQGAITYQDRPCLSGGKELTPASTGTGSISYSTSDAEALAKQAQSKRDVETLRAIQQREPAIGMTLAELNLAMGRPDAVNPSNYNGRLHNQLIYNRGQRRLYVYTDGGKVTAIQDRSNPSAPKPLPAGQRCPTSIEIQNARNSANSTSLTEDQRKAKWKQVESMESCGKR